MDIDKEKKLHWLVNTLVKLFLFPLFIESYVESL